MGKNRFNIAVKIILFFLPLIILSQDIQKQFITDYISGKDIISYVDGTEIKLSERLGITFEAMPNVFHLWYKMDSIIISKINNSEVDYTIDYITIDAVYKQVIIKVKKPNYKRVFTFKNNKLINNLFYYTKDWDEIKSKYFVFKVYNKADLNKYVLNELDSFADNLCKNLKIEGSDLEKLQSSKINYYLFRKNEFDSIAEFESGGYFSPIFGDIVTYQKMHYHEVAHALMVYKLKEQKPFTHPFIREGFAVSFGGCSVGEINMNLKTSMDLAYYIYSNSLISYDSLYNIKRFRAYDFIGFAYPVSGFYNNFLFNKIGLEEYLILYIENSYKYTNEPIVFKPYKDDSKTEFDKFVDTYRTDITPIQESFFYDTNTVFVSTLQNEYHFNKGEYLFTPKVNDQEDFKSDAFVKFFPGRSYNKERYLFTAYDKFIKIYDLYLDTIIAIYINLKMDTETFQTIGSYNTFKVNKNLFEGDLMDDYTYEKVN